MLLEAPPGSFCSLEVLDDTATEHPDGTAHLGQSKSALGDNPVADRATSLWKTFYNWSQLVQKGLIYPEKTSFELYVSKHLVSHRVEIRRRRLDRRGDFTIPVNPQDVSPTQASTGNCLETFALPYLAYGIIGGKSMESKPVVAKV